MENKIEKICKKYNLGSLKSEPEIVTGGLLHKMYHVITDRGEYAIKCLNPNIMKKTEALQNMINSEIVSNALISIIPLVAAKRFDGNAMIEFDGFYYMIFDWIDGRSIFAPHITEYHCEQIGQILGKIHAANLSVGSMEKSNDIRSEYDWNMLFKKVQQSNIECCSLLQNNLDDIIRWDHHVVNGLQLLSENQVISHRDLDPKNVMWKNNKPYIIDWESAGYVNPYQELTEVFNYWISEDNGKYNKTKFDAMIQAYTQNMNINNVNWDVVMDCSFDGMLGWLAYSIKRALGMESSSVTDQQEGIQQIKGTLCELKKYEDQMVLLKDWINEYVRENTHHNF